MLPAQTSTNLLSVFPQTAKVPQDINSLSPPSTASGGVFDILFDSFLGKLFPFHGLLLFDESGEFIHSNSKATTLCQTINQELPLEASNNALSQNLSLPERVTRVCECLIDARNEFPGHPLQIYEDIFLEDGVRIHLSARWIEIQESAPKILVQLEDATQTAVQQALCDACRYHLTPRETEVWTLYLQGHSYQDVGEKLFIAPCTVRKHMKSIHAKRREAIA